MSTLESTIRNALSGNVAAVRVHATLVPATGGQRILPPTYAAEKSGEPGRHNMTAPSADGASAWVSIDSPGSFANRVEQALVAVNLGLDPLRVSVTGRAVSTMQLPHRAFDAVVRDSVLDGTPFRKTDIGRGITEATASNATALLRYDPSVLLLGGWDSTKLGMAGGSGNKWPAALTVEIAARDVVPVMRAGNRIDPLGIEGTEATLVEEADGTLRLATTDDLQTLKKATGKSDDFPRLVKPSQVNHGNILSLTPKGVLVRGGIELHGALSLTRLRRYKFDGVDPIDARALIALMGVYGASAVLNDGLDLRRDCELVPESVTWELVGPSSRDTLEVDVGEARSALTQARARVALSDPVLLTATDALEHLVARYAS